MGGSGSGREEEASEGCYQGGGSLYGDFSFTYKKLIYGHSGAPRHCHNCQNAYNYHNGPVAVIAAGPVAVIAAGPVDDDIFLIYLNINALHVIAQIRSKLTSYEHLASNIPNPCLLGSPSYGEEQVLGSNTLCRLSD